MSQVDCKCDKTHPSPNKKGGINWAAYENNDAQEGMRQERHQKYYRKM